MRSTLISLAASLLLGTCAIGAQETVTYPELSGVKSISYTSEFFGYQSGVNRDFTNYGRGFDSAVPQHIGWTRIQAALADMNGDGLDDLVGYYPDTGKIRWVAGKGNGAFDEANRGEADASPKRSLTAGDFSGDGRPDIGLVGAEDVAVLYAKPSGGLSPEVTVQCEVPVGQVAAGDVNGDGMADIVSYDTSSGTIIIFLAKKGGGFGRPVTSGWNAKGLGGKLAVADMNGDHYADIALYGSTVCHEGFYFRFGRGDGMFGPTADEAKTTAATHLASKVEWPVNGSAIPAAGQIDSDGAGDIALYFPSLGLSLARTQSGDPAYDYSVHIVRDGSQYKMWHGGRWRTLDSEGKVMKAADGDHVMFAWSSDGRKWFRKIDGAVFPKGDELGIQAWWSNNYLEPEVLKVKGTYYMYWQAEIDPGHKVDTGETAVQQCDRIGLSTSTDGVTWTRKTDRGVVINIPNPTATNLDHQEVIYVANDKDGKPWWLYTFHFVDGKPAGHVRIRSNDPTTFDWSDREAVSGMSQIGNQIAYADEAPGGRMFFRITFTGDGKGRTVPTLQLSRDGLNWVSGQGRPQLAASVNEKDNRNVYFLGISTVDGTGKLEYRGSGRFHAVYGATTSNGPGQPHIWKSEIGVGEVLIQFNAEGNH